MHTRKHPALWWICFFTFFLNKTVGRRKLNGFYSNWQRFTSRILNREKHSTEYSQVKTGFYVLYLSLAAFLSPWKRALKKKLREKEIWGSQWVGQVGGRGEVNQKPEFLELAASQGWLEFVLPGHSSFSTMALLMIPHTFFIPYSLEISFHQSSNMILRPPYELDKTGIINALFTYGGNRGLETGNDPCPSPHLAKPRLERTETSGQGSSHHILMPPGMRNLGNVMEMGRRIQSQGPLN